MGNSVRNAHIKMDKANRAKQFMPFDALTGFREALREKERSIETEKEHTKVAIDDNFDLQLEEI